MAGRGDPGCEVNVPADVGSVRHERRARVQPDPDPDRPRCQAPGDLGRSRDRARGGREGGEERVALCVDLDAPVRGAGAPDHLPVLGESRRVLLRAELVQQAGRAFDVREEERDGAGGQVAVHRSRIAARRGRRRAGDVRRVFAGDSTGHVGIHRFLICRRYRRSAWLRRSLPSVRRRSFGNVGVSRAGPQSPQEAPWWSPPASWCCCTASS